MVEPLNLQISTDLWTSPTQFIGRATQLTNDFYKLEFEVPAKGIRGGEIKFSAITLNQNQKWSLDELIKYQTLATSAAADFKIRGWEIWHNEKWLNIDLIQEQILESDIVRMRFRVSNTNVKINHIEIDWRKSSELKFQNQKVALKIDPLLEVIGFDQLKQSFDGNDLIVEFESRLFDKEVKSSQVLKSQYQLEDIRHPSFINIRITDQVLRTLETGTRLTTTGWKSVFKIKNKTYSVSACRRVF